MALNYRRGSAAIQDATAQRGGDFRPFIPQINWKRDDESKYVLVLTDIEGGVYELLLHQFIPVSQGKKANGDEFTRYEEFISRRDPAIGEDYDDLEDRLERQPKTRILGVMVELEPVMEAGTKKLKGFTAKTDTFARNTNDGEVEVTAPAIGICTQSAAIFWQRIDGLWRDLGDLTAVPIKITRRGEDKSTQYDMIPYLEKPVDLSPVINFVDGINYVGDDLDDVVRSIEAETSEVAQAQAIADFLLNKRVNELADKDRYDELISALELDDMPKNAWGRKQAGKKTPTARPARPARRSPREAQEETPEPPAEPSKTDKFAALKSRVEARG